MSAVAAVRGPADVLALVPYLTGFHPELSLVCVCVQEKRLGMVARVDLPRTAAERREVARVVVPPVIGQHPTGVLVIGYGTAKITVAKAVRALAEDLSNAGVRRVEAEIVVVGDRFQTLCDCCPGDPQPMPGDDHPCALDYRVATGVDPLPSRRSLVEGIAAGPRAQEVGTVCAALSQVSLEQAGTAWAAVLTADRPVGDLPALTLAEAAHSLAQHRTFRDALMGRLCPGLVAADEFAAEVTAAVDSVGLSPTPDAEVMAERLRALCQCLPDTHAVAPASVLAGLYWSSGRGALGRVTVERALAADPGYSLAQLIEQLFDLAVIPPAFA